jgi:hypothetical protein
MMDLTIVTPAKITTQEELNTAIESVTALYKTLGNERPLHLLSTLITDARLRKEYFAFLSSLGANVEEIAKDQNYMQAFRTLMGAIKTKYGYFHSTDVVTSSEKNFFLPCMEAMDQDETMVQIRLGGYPISNYDTNLDVFGVDDGKIIMLETADPLERVPLSTGDTIWSISMAARNQGKFYAIPFWNCIMRKTFIHELLHATDPLVKPGEWSMSDYLAHINGAPDMVEYSMGNSKAGWPAPYEFIETSKQGLLNLSCYVYALGRESRPLDEFKIVNMMEVRSVKDLSDWINRDRR